ncbi:MAG: ribonuclease PH [Planctomycetes bacterium]|nr:ribonuclease PH [Planctomycetota bacterium]
MPRHDGRASHQSRPLRFERGFTKSAPGSVLACYGETQVLCTAMATDGVPPFLQGRGKGWLTAEYSMLPSASGDRKQRDRNGKVDGRSTEIQRLIGRSLRAVVDTAKMTERTIWIDCDVLQADGGTRTAAISGAYVALVDLLKHMERQRVLRAWPLVAQIAAVSVGIVNGEPVVDLDYVEDSKAEVDMNLVMLGDGRYVEIQGCAEARAFDRAQLDRMLALGEGALREIMGAQREALEAAVAG